VFSSSRFDRKLLLRGVYFTSGTQTGAPIDRIMAAVGREFGFAPQSTESQPAAGRAYFVERLLKGVVFSESGLAGTQFRVEARKALLQLAAYVGCVALGTLAVVWLSISFASNRSYLREVDEANATFAASGVAQIAPDAPLEEMIGHLDGLRAITDVAERHGEPAPWTMRAGLYQPRAMGENARDAYVREINNYLVPLLSEQIRDRLADVAAEPENLFESLKAYLLLHDPERYTSGKAAVASVANLEWQQRYGSDASVPARLNAHLAALLASEQLPSPPPLDADRVARARGSLVGLTAARLVYARIHREYSEDPDSALHLDVAAGLHSEKVFVRRSRVPLGDPFGYIYTRRAFEEISSKAAAKAVASFAADAWVFGEHKPSLSEQARLPFEVLDVYEDDYIASWDRLIGDVALKTFSPAEVPEALRILSAADSPLRSFVRLITDNTNLVKPGAKGAANVVKKLGGPAAGLVRKGQAIGNALDGGRPPAGTRITEHFRPLAAAAPAVDKCLGTLTLIQQQIEAGGQGYVNNNAMAALNQGGSLGLARGLQDCAESLPAPLNAIMKQAAGGAQAVAVNQVRGALGDKMAQQLGGAQCKQTIAGRYPFIVSSGNDVPLGDFGRVFGAGGTLDVFFRDNLAPMVDVQGARWAWREVADAQVALGPGVLPNFQRAAWIRDAFFPQGGQQPRVQFTLMAESLDADVVRFVLEFDGQRFEYRHDPPQAWSATWPGPAPGSASIRFEDRNGQGPTQPFQGPWALFRLFGTAEFQRRSETRYLVIFRAGGKSARVVLEASSIRNPFDRDMLTPFRCPG
jgi:type VI secretion system protein ImpL